MPTWLISNALRKIKFNYWALWRDSLHGVLQGSGGYIVLTMVPGYQVSVRVGTKMKAPALVRNLQAPRNALSWRVHYPERTYTHGFVAWLNPDRSSILRSPQLGLELIIWVLIISWHDEYADYAVLPDLSPPASRFLIRLIFVEWLWNKGKFETKFAGYG